QHGSTVVTLWHLRVEVAAAGKARREQCLIAGMPAPAARLRQRTEQIIGRQTGQQQLAVEQPGLTQENFASRVHGASYKSVMRKGKGAGRMKPRHCCQSAVPAGRFLKSCAA